MAFIMYLIGSIMIAISVGNIYIHQLLGLSHWARYLFLE